MCFESLNWSVFFFNTVNQVFPHQYLSCYFLSQNPHWANAKLKEKNIAPA